MKKIFILLIFISILFCSPILCVPEVHASDISDTFTQKYNDLKPPENSSVHSDYIFEQIALGSEYTIIMLNDLVRQNSSLDEKADIIIDKFDILIEQNKKIIELLNEK